MPSKVIDPATIRPGGFGTSRAIERAVTLLPQPDSPTRPSVSPYFMSKLTSSTACTTPLGVKKWVDRPRTSSRMSEARAVFPDGSSDAPDSRTPGVTSMIVGRSASGMSASVVGNYCFPFSLGSSASRRPSPRKVKLIRAIAMQMAGKSTRCGDERITFWPSATRLPQDARGAWTPTPM